MRRKAIIYFLLAVVSILWFCGTNPDRVKVRLVRVHDGDTFVVDYNGKYVSVRLIGIDTPEITGNFKARNDAKKTHSSLQSIIAAGKAAKRFVQTIVYPGMELTLEFDVQRIDKYGRLLAYVFLPDGRMLNEILLREGYASLMTIPPNVKYEKRFREAYIYGRENHKGLWK